MRTCCGPSERYLSNPVLEQDNRLYQFLAGEDYLTRLDARLKRSSTAEGSRDHRWIGGYPFVQLPRCRIAQAGDELRGWGDPLVRFSPPQSKGVNQGAAIDFKHNKLAGVGENALWLPIPVGIGVTWRSVVGLAPSVPLPPGY